MNLEKLLRKFGCTPMTELENPLLFRQNSSRVNLTSGPQQDSQARPVRNAQTTLQIDRPTLLFLPLFRWPRRSRGPGRASTGQLRLLIQ
jgi:hypothetical protein